MFPTKIPRITFWRSVFLIVLASGLYSTYLRFSAGLGASTALSDRFPWGLWIGFDVLCGVALAAGGFTISAVVYVFNIERFKPIIRPTILTAFSGYLLVIVALLFDLGRPYRIWHPLVMWNPRSVMFEVAWCVTLYTIVLALEFSPILFQRLRLEKPLRIIQSITIPLVMLGVILSTLHQSSLGSLYLIVPHKLHPLWYSPLLPLFFFVSAIGLGCAMTIVESFLSYRAFRKRLEIDLLSDLGKVIVVTLSVYLILRMQDVMGRGVLNQAFQATYEGRMFLAEVLLGIIAPVVLLIIPRIRGSHFSLFVASLLVVLGFIMNRLNVSITGMEGALGNYFPSWTEVSVTSMIVALGFVLFSTAVKYLPVFPPEETEDTKERTGGEWLAPNVLRQPLFSSTTLALVLGGLFLGSSLLLGGNGLWHRMQMKSAVASKSALSPSGVADRFFTMPPDITLPTADTSPGVVTFRHSSHLDAKQANCAQCHVKHFRILRVNVPTATTASARDLHSDQFCGACHNGEKSFSVKEDCQLCHQEKP
ncbi:MAG TPA: Ni/Fe-hydrogenase cytochrome b subunit [Terriglobia bacterium]|nr:Ni/Fe-hydrogenase cytochrome b subunit [Terriglobia bacterium]